LVASYQNLQGFQNLGGLLEIQMRKIEQLYKHLWKMEKENAALKARLEKLEK